MTAESVAGVSPSAVGYEVRLGRVGRENAITKSLRLLVDGRVAISYVGPNGVKAGVRGDSGHIRNVVFDRRSDQWSCGCSARGRCSHIMAVLTVVVLPAPQ